MNAIMIQKHPCIPSCSLYGRFQPVCNTGTSVVRRAVLFLRHRPLTGDYSLRLGLEALVHHAALTAYHKDRRARGLPGETHACLDDARRLGHSPYLAPGDLPCPTLRHWTASASALTPLATGTVSLFSGLIVGRPP